MLGGLLRTALCRFASEADAHSYDAFVLRRTQRNLLAVAGTA
jgi:hypothetical protein